MHVVLYLENGAALGEARLEIAHVAVHGEQGLVLARRRRQCRCQAFGVVGSCAVRLLLLLFVVALALKVGLDAQVADGQAQDGELVELGEHVGLERQQAGQVLELGVEAFAVTLARIGLLTLFGRMLVAVDHDDNVKGREDENAFELESRRDWLMVTV